MDLPGGLFGAFLSAQKGVHFAAQDCEQRLVRVYKAAALIDQLPDLCGVLGGESVLDPAEAAAAVDGICQCPFKLGLEGGDALCQFHGIRTLDQRTHEAPCRLLPGSGGQDPDAGILPAAAVPGVRALSLAQEIAAGAAALGEARQHIGVLQAVAEAETIVFDKTGTLTHAVPRVKRVIPFDGNDEAEMLRLAACLEEHYPHSIANAVVKTAEERGLFHEEKHTKAIYVVAHGIASTINGEKVCIGSHHYIFDDERCIVPPGETDKFDELPNEYSHLYMAIDNRLAAVILIEDPLREEAASVVEKLKKVGFSKVVMMTGDNERTARDVAHKTGVTDYFSEVLPEDKAAFIRKEHEAGRKVIMIGDGINDSPALSEADAGIAVSSGASIAREIADITISSDNLEALLTLREISTRLMDRIRFNYRTIIGFNSGLILLGILGVLAPTGTALLHNASTVAISLKSMTDLMDSEKK